MDLREAVNFINNYRRIESDPDLLVIQTCSSCKENFPSLRQDASLRKSKGIDPKCRICFRDERRKALNERQKQLRQAKKNKQ